MNCFARVPSPVGELVLVGRPSPSGLELNGLYFAEAAHAAHAVPTGAAEDPQAFAAVRAQLEAYLAGTREVFELRLAPVGTDFQRAVWRALSDIPYGATATYAEIASRIGRPRAVRAVGAANGKNPLSIVVPCHRVIGKDGTLTGYAGGLHNKQRLLELEAKHISLNC